MALSEPEISSYAPAVPFFSIIIGVLSLYMLDRLTGRFSNIDKFIASRSWCFINRSKDNYVRFKIYFRLVIVTLILMCPISFGVWVIGLFLIEDYSNKFIILPIAALSIGICALSFALGFGFLRWNKYEMSFKSGFFFALGALSFIAYQVTGNFVGVTEYSFFGISAVFLCYNSLAFMFLLFINAGKHRLTFLEMLTSKIPQQTIITNQEIHYQVVENKDNIYMLTKEEIERFFTLNEDETSLFSGGVALKFGILSPRTQQLLSSLLYIISLLILGAYASIIYAVVEEYKLGLITAIATVATDSIIFVFYYTDISNSVFQLSFTAVMFRLLLFVFGGTYWFYGYCVLYLFIGVIAVANIAAKYFPLSEALKINTIITSKVKDNKRFKFLRSPEFLFIYSSLLFIGLTVILYYTEPYGAPLPSVYTYGKEYEFWLIASFAFTLVIIAYFFIAIIRMIKRDDQKIGDPIVSSTFWKCCNTFWVHVFLCFFTFQALGGNIFTISGSLEPFIFCSIIPFIIILMLRVYIYYRKNDYSVLKDIARENTRILTKKSILQNEIPEEYSDLGDNPPVSHSTIEVKTDTKVELQEDWTKQHCVVSAFFKGKLHWNDYQIIIGIIVIILAAFGNASSLQSIDESDDSLYGYTLAFIMVDSFLVFIGNFKFIVTGINFNLWNIIFIIIGTVAHFVYGIIYFSKREGGNLYVNGNFFWVLLYVIIVPGLLVFSMGFYRWYANKWRHSRYTVVMLVIFFLFSSGLFGFIDNYYGGYWGVLAFSCAAIFWYYMGFAYYYIAIKPGTSVNAYVAVIGGLFLLSVIAGIISKIVGDMPQFISYTISYGSIVIIFLCYFSFRLIRTCVKYNANPLFLSSYVFPAFIYDFNKEVSVSYNLYVAAVYGFLKLVALWGITASFNIEPMHYGISVTCIVVVIFSLMTFFLITYVSIKIQDCNDWLTLEILTKSWLKAKRCYIENQNITNVNELVSCRKLKEVKQIIKERIGEMVEIRLSPRETITVNMRELTDKKQEVLLSRIEEKLKEQYENEIELFINFQVLSVANSINSKINYRIRILKFLKEKRNELKAAEIFIKVANISNERIRHSYIVEQIEKLDQSKREVYDRLYKEFESEQELLKLKEKEKEKQAEKVQVAKLEARNKTKVNITDPKGITIDDMPDSLEKFNAIKNDYRNKKLNGSVYHFKDKQFPPSQQSLGENIVCKVKEWKSVNENKNLTLYYGNKFAMNVKQGLLGDCYYLSAITVIGERYIQACIVNTRDDIEHGAYCVRFYNTDGSRDYIIVDDQFPLSHRNEWAFATSENKKEIWPMVLEKAYAKLYGSYENIEEGKVSYALADLTGGVPEELKISDISENFEDFKKLIMRYYKAGYLMGAGSVANELGNAVVVHGIIKRHAYSILELAEFRDEILIRLRNPHGAGGQEWDGDWSDSSDKWTEAARIQLKRKETNYRDGTFWMSLMDFMFYFDNLYICRLFDEGWNCKSVEGIWKDKTAPGLPSENNPSAEVVNNPQYLLTITKPSTLFIMLTQSERVNMFRGKQLIYFFVANNNRKRIKKISNSIKFASTYPPIDLITVSKELVVDNNMFYPVNLTIMVSTQAGGIEGNYTLKVHCTDEKFDLVEID